MAEKAETRSRVYIINAMVIHSQNKKKLIYQALIQSIPLHAGHTATKHTTG
jgi:hypothetical protein